MFQVKTKHISCISVIVSVIVLAHKKNEMSSAAPFCAVRGLKKMGAASSFNLVAMFCEGQRHKFDFQSLLRFGD